MSDTAVAPETESAAKPQPYWWFQGKAVRELFDRIDEAGPDVVRLEVRLSGESITFRVVNVAVGAVTNGDDQPDINNSHRCPPQCA